MTDEKNLEEMTLEQLQEQANKLQDEIRQRQKAEVAKARAQIREIASQHGLEVTIRAKGREEEREAREPAKAKYRNPDDPSQTWTGRGRAPFWLQSKIDTGAQKEDFLIQWE